MFHCWKAKRGFEIVTQLVDTGKITILTSMVYAIITGHPLTFFFFLAHSHLEFVV
jgi:hypothetical protein